MKQTWMVALGATFFAPTLAIAAPGDLLVTEFFGDSVLEFSAGGDLTEAERFATGLSGPVGICVGPDNAVYVAESSTGEITIIPPEGGDLTDAEPYAQAAAGIGGLWCDNTRIVISCPLCFPMASAAAVVEIQEGGLVTETATFLAYNFPLSGDTFYDAAGDLHVLAGEIYDISAGGDLIGSTPVGTGIDVLAGFNLGGTILAGQAQGNVIYDVTALGDLSMEPAFATLPDLGEGNGGVQAFMQTEAGVIYVSHGDEIYEMPAGGGDLTGATPFATGLQTSLLVQGMVEHVCGGNEDCADEDLCNGDELCVDNRCVEPKGPPDCDDDDICTADSCDATEGCDNAPIDNCCISDLECAIDEICDLEDNQCVPASSPTSGSESDTEGDSDSNDTEDPSTTGEETDGDTIGTTGMGTSSTTAGTSTSGVTATATAGETGDEGDTDTDGAGADGDSGCGCTANPEPEPSLLLLGLLALGFVRRRR